MGTWRIGAMPMDEQGGPTRARIGIFHTTVGTSGCISAPLPKTLFPSIYPVMQQQAQTGWFSRGSYTQGPWGPPRCAMRSPFGYRNAFAWKSLSLGWGIFCNWGQTRTESLREPGDGNGCLRNEACVCWFMLCSTMGELIQQDGEMLRLCV